jgi:hypothetical protein
MLQCSTNSRTRNYSISDFPQVKPAFAMTHNVWKIADVLRVSASECAEGRAKRADIGSLDAGVAARLRGVVAIADRWLDAAPQSSPPAATLAIWSRNHR